MLMKKIIFILLLSTGFWGCSQQENSSKKEVAPAMESEHHEYADNPTGLQLNNGIKWMADSSTHNNVLLLQATLENFKSSSDRNLETYHALAVELQRGLSKMVNECKMKGADHDALHLWLEPLMGQVRDLKKSSAMAIAARLTETIQQQLNDYHQYFQA